MPQIPESSSTNWDLDPIYNDYPDDAAVVVQALEAHGVQDYSADHLPQVTTALRKDGLASINIIFGIDFNQTNEWKGKLSFDCQSLHATGYTPNPYEKVISVLGKTLVPFSEDNMIPCYGFGDETTHDKKCLAFTMIIRLAMVYKKFCPATEKYFQTCNSQVGPTSYAPVVDAAINIVEKSCGKYHILFIITDGQATRSVNTSDEELSPQEEQTIESIVNASSYPLSIVLVGVGDGPWEDMQKFEEKNQKILERKFNNFQFVNFTEIMSENATPSENETAFAIAALMKTPSQYKAAIELGIVGRVTGTAKKITPLPPPAPHTRSPVPAVETSNSSSPMADIQTRQVCPICLTNEKDLAFGCGHLTCQDCGARLSNCPICRQPIRNHLRLFIG